MQKNKDKNIKKAEYFNSTAYDGFEDLNNFGDLMEVYKKGKMDALKNHIRFIRKIFPKRKIIALELCSGNSKLLFALEQAGMLKKGYGVEISKSRYKFAEKWRKDGDFKMVKNINANILDLDYNSFEKIDACFILDLAFQYFEPNKKNAPLNILKNIYKRLNDNGKIIIELDGCQRVIKNLKNDKLKNWEEFLLPDPWKFSLWDCCFDRKNKFLAWKRIFIKRDKPEFSESTVVLKIYDKNEICQLLKKAGFSKINLYSDWKGRKYKDDTFEYTIVATK